MIYIFLYCPVVLLYIFLSIFLFIYLYKYFSILPPECEEGPGVCALLMTAVSLFIILLSLPVSLIFVVKVVQVRRVWPLIGRK